MVCWEYMILVQWLRVIEGTIGYWSGKARCNFFNQHPYLDSLSPCRWDISVPWTPIFLVYRQTSPHSCICLINFVVSNPFLVLTKSWIFHGCSMKSTINWEPMWNPWRAREPGDPGEAYLIRLGAFGMFGHTASWRIIDLSKGVVREGTMTAEMMPGWGRWRKWSKGPPKKRGIYGEDVVWLFGFFLTFWLFWGIPWANKRLGLVASSRLWWLMANLTRSFTINMGI